MYGVAYSPSVLDHVAKAMWDCSIRFRMAARTYGHRGHGQTRDFFLSHGHVIDLEVGVSSWPNILRSNTNTALLRS
jgi:hypothetical protein